MKGLKQVILLGIFYLLLITTYSSFSFIITYIYQHQQNKQFVGPLILLSNYTIFMIANTFAPGIRLSLVTQMKIGALTKVINYAAQLLPIQGNIKIIILVFGSMIEGSGSALIWVVYGEYVKALTKKNNQEHIEGKYFSVVNSICFSNQLIGNLITSFCLDLFSNQIYFLILTVLGLFSLIYCQLFIKDLPRVNDNPKQYKICQEISKVFSFYFKMKNLLFLIVIDGLMLAFSTVTLSKLIPKDSDEKRDKFNFSIVLITFGVGTIIGGFLSGYLSQNISVKKAGIISTIFFAVCCIYTLLNLQYPSLTMGFIAGFLWGIQLYLIEGWLYVACCAYFDGKPQTFAVTKQVHSIFFCLFQIFILFEKNPNLFIVMTVFLILIFPACFFLNKLENKQFKIKDNKSNSGDINYEALEEPQ